MRRADPRRLAQKLATFFTDRCPSVPNGVTVRLVPSQLRFFPALVYTGGGGRYGSPLPSRRGRVLQREAQSVGLRRLSSLH